MRWLLNVKTLSCDWMLFGRPFRKLGPATANARLPNWSLCFGAFPVLHFRLIGDYILRSITLNTPRRDSGLAVCASSVTMRTISSCWNESRETAIRLASAVTSGATNTYYGRRRYYLCHRAASPPSLISGPSTSLCGPTVLTESPWSLRWNYDDRVTFATSCSDASRHGLGRWRLKPRKNWKVTPRSNGPETIASWAVINGNQTWSMISLDLYRPWLTDNTPVSVFSTRKPCVYAWL